MDTTESTLAPELTSPLLRAQLPRGADESQRGARRRKRAMMRRLRHTLLLLGIAAATIASVLALRPRPLPMDVAKVSRGPLEVVIEESGITWIADRYLVSAPVTGELARVVLEPGDTVAEDDKLVSIAPARAALLDTRTRQTAAARLSAALQALGQARALQGRALAARDLAQQELARERQLSSDHSTPRQVLEQAEFMARMRDEELASAGFASKVAAEEVRVARAALAGGDASESGHALQVVAPTSGAVLRVHQKSAGVVAAGTPLLELGDPHSLEVVVDLLTTDAVQVHPGTVVSIDGWGGPHSIAGRVHRIEPSAFTRASPLGVDEQRVNVIVKLTDPVSRWAKLGDGYRVEVRLVLWRSAGVTKVPHGAVFRHGAGWAAFRVDDGVAKRVPIEVGHRGESEIEITRGLEPGATVGLHPGDRIKDGVAVTAR